MLKKKKVLVLIILIISLLALAGIVFGALMLLDNLGILKMTPTSSGPKWDEIPTGTKEAPNFDPYPLSLYFNWKDQGEDKIYRLKTDERILYIFYVKDIASIMGYSYEQDGDKTTLTSDSKKIVLEAGKLGAQVNGQVLELPMQPMLDKSGAMVIDESALCVVFDAKAAALLEMYLYNITTETYEGKVDSYKGSNVFYINGKPCAPSIYEMPVSAKGGAPWEKEQQGMISDFAKAGYNIMITEIYFPNIMNNDKDFSLNIAEVRRKLCAFLKANPNAYMLVRVELEFPEQWRQAHKDEWVDVANKNAVPEPASLDADGKTVKNISFASEPGWKLIKEKLQEFYDLILAAPEGSRLVGMHIGGGVYTEWHPFGISAEPDTGKAMTKYFQNFAKEKYGDINKINNVWKTSYSSVNAITVPDLNTRNTTKDGDFRDPAQERYLLDYFDAHQKVVTDLVLDLGKLTKEAFKKHNRDVIIGTFWSYLWENASVTTGQGEVERVMKSPYIDYFSAPYSYAHRPQDAGRAEPDGSAYFRTIAHSCALNGKIFISENDSSTHLKGQPSWLVEYTTSGETESISLMKRTYAYTFTENAGQWWYDFGSTNGSIFNTPGMMNAAKKLMELSNKYLNKDYDNHADVLVVYDIQSYKYMRQQWQDRVSDDLCLSLTNSLQKVGASYNRIFAFDLEKIDLKQYKLVIFADVLYMSKETRNTVKNKVMKDGRNVWFIYGTGYTDGTKNDVAYINDITGMTVQKVTQGSSSVRTNVSFDGYSVTCQSSPLVTYFKPTGGYSETLGKFQSGDAAFVARSAAGGGKIYYYGATFNGKGNEYMMMRTLFKRCGVRIYAEGADYTAAGGGVICAYSRNGASVTLRSVSGSTKTVNLGPRVANIYDSRTLELLF